MFHVLKGGCGTRHPSSFRLSRPKGLPNYVILIVKTPGEFLINEQHYTVAPAHAILLSPNTPYFYGNSKGDYIDDWVHFEVENVTHFKEQLAFTNKPFPIRNTEMFTNLIRQILWEKSYTQPQFSQQNIDALFTVLINHLTASYRTMDNLKLVNHYQDDLQLLRLQLQNTLAKTQSIEEYARKMGVSSSYFQHLYTSFFGISFRKDLIRIRIEHAKYIMRSTDLTFEQIAGICGYNNEVHFYRQFKQSTGITPAKYRKVEHLSSPVM